MRYLLPVWFGSLALVVGCGNGEPAVEGNGEPAAEEYPGAVAADPDHYAVEFENDVARLLRITYGPGETSVMHEHPETCSVSLTDASWSMTAPSGEVTEEDPSSIGAISCENPASVHSPANTGTSTNEVILVEWKEGATAGSAPASDAPDAIEADPDHYAVVFENEVARVLSITYGPGEQSVMHYHPATCFVSLNDGVWHMTNTEGEVTEQETPLGLVGCTDAEVHQPANATQDTARVFLVEFKNRQAVE